MITENYERHRLNLRAGAREAKERELTVRLPGPLSSRAY